MNRAKSGRSFLSPLQTALPRSNDPRICHRTMRAAAEIPSRGRGVRRSREECLGLLRKFHTKGVVCAGCGRHIGSRHDRSFRRQFTWCGRCSSGAPRKSPPTAIFGTQPAVLYCQPPTDVCQLPSSDLRNLPTEYCQLSESPNPANRQLPSHFQPPTPANRKLPTDDLARPSP